MYIHIYVYIYIYIYVYIYIYIWGEEGGKEEEQDNKAQDIQDMDEQQRFVSRCSNFKESFVPLK